MRRGRVLRDRFVVVAMVAIGAAALVPTAAGAATLTFTTAENPFSDGAYNQGWHGSTQAHVPGNDNYFTGDTNLYYLPAEYRSFFTFDLASLNEDVVAARLVLKRFNVRSSDASETLGLFDVSTDARRLYYESDVSPAIFDDLGSGTTYGSFSISTADDASGPVELNLSAAAVADINAARGGPFSIGGRILSLPGGVFGGFYDEAYFVSLELETGRRPSTKLDCQQEGWRNLVDDTGRLFENQGRCVSSITARR